MFHKIKSVTPEKNFKLLVWFLGGTTKRYDVAALFDKWPAFLALKNIPGLFENVKIDTGGYGVSWNDDIDLSCDELWDNGTAVNTPFDDLLSFGDATNLWDLSESTLRKAIQYGKLVDGIDVHKFGKQWIITKSAMLREYGNPENIKKNLTSTKEKTYQNKFNLFDDLVAGLEDGIAFEKGDKTRCRVQIRSTNIPRYYGKDVRKLRLRLNLSQRDMAAALGVSPRTVESWEAGNNVPNRTAQHLLYLFDKQPQLVNDLIEKEPKKNDNK